MTYNFRELYSAANIHRWRVPEHQFLDAEYGEFRAPHLRWSEIEHQVADQGKLAMLLICCDVLELEKTPILTIPTFIFARQIEVAEGAEITIDLTSEKEISFVLATQKIVRPNGGEDTELIVGAVTLNENGELSEVESRLSANPDRGATAFVLEKGDLRASPANPAQIALDFLAPGDPLSTMLTTTFQLACLLSTEHPRLAADQVMWIAALTARHSASHALSSDSHALYKTLLQIMEIGSDALLVPELDHEIYAEESRACLALLNQRAERYETLVSRMENDDRWREQVAVTIEDKQNEAELAASLRAQCESTCDHMREARRIAASNLLECQDGLGDLMVDFQRGILDWQRDETIKASIEIFTGVVDLLQQVGTIVASGGTLAVLPVADSLKLIAGMSVDLSSRAAASTTTNNFDDVIDISWLFADDDDTDQDAENDAVYVAETTKTELIEYFESRAAEKAAAESEKSRQQKIKNSASELKKAGMAAGKDVKGIYDGIMRIVDIAAKAKKLEEQSEGFLLKAAAQTNTAFGSIDPIGLDFVTGGEDGWAQTELGLEDMFDKIGDLMTKLGGGRAYRLALRRLILFGRTMSQARLALAKANSDLADAILRENSAQVSVRIYERHLRDLSKSRARDTALKQLAFNRVLDSKRSVYLAMEAFMRASSYFTLKPVNRDILPNITDSVDQISEAVTKNTGKWVTSLALGKSPGPLDLTLSIDLDESEIIRNEDGSLTMRIPMDHKRFHRWYRVRLEALRVFTDGLQSDGDLWIDIQSDGLYMDRSETGQTHSFITRPFARSFVYNPNNETATPLGDSSSTGRFAEDFFKPTPFSTWRFTISRQDEQDLDFNTLTGLRLHLQGNVMS